MLGICKHSSVHLLEVLRCTLTGHVHCCYLAMHLPSCFSTVYGYMVLTAMAIPDMYIAEQQKIGIQGRDESMKQFSIKLPCRHLLSWHWSAKTQSWRYRFIRACVMRYVWFVMCMHKYCTRELCHS